MKTRKDLLQDLFLAVRKNFLNKGVIEENATAVARAIYMRVAFDDKMTDEDIKTLRNEFLK